MRIFLTAVFLLLGTGSFAEAQNKCALAISETRTDALRWGLHEAQSKDSAFPEIAVSDFLKRHFADLNTQIDDLLITTRDQINSDLSQKTNRLSELNETILAHSKAVQKMLNPGALGRWMRGKDAAVTRTNDLVSDISFCRTRGDACAAEIRPALETLERYHRELENFSSVLEEEILSLQQILAEKRAANPAISTILERQQESLSQARIPLMAQLQIHKNLVFSALTQLHLFEENLKNSARILMVTTPKGAASEKELLQLMGKDKPEFVSSIEKFEVGSGIEVGLESPHTTGVIYRSGSVVEILPDSYLSVKLKDQSKIFKSTPWTISAHLAVLIGCHHGVCSGDGFVLPSGIPLKSANQFDPQASEFFPMNILFRHSVVGFNPLRNEFLLTLSNAEGTNEKEGTNGNTRAWIKGEDLISLKKGQKPPSLAKMHQASRENLRVGDFAMITGPFNRRSDLDESVPVLISGIDGENVTISPLLRSHRGVSKVVDRSKIFPMKCAHGFCSGQLVETPLYNGVFQVSGYDETTKRFFINYHEFDRRHIKSQKSPANPTTWGLWAEPGQISALPDFENLAP